MSPIERLSAVLGCEVVAVHRTTPAHGHRLGPQRDARGQVVPRAFRVVLASGRELRMTVPEVRRGGLARRLGVGPRALLAALHEAAESPPTEGASNEPEPC